MDIYTDGACQGKGKYGGWAAIFLENDEKIKEVSGYELNTTNQRMELQAALEALKAIPQDTNTPIKLYSDSAYLVNAFRDDWFKSWKRNGWKTQDRKDVKNQDIWKPLEELARKHKVEFIFVKGHASNPHNNYCDKVAVQEVGKAKVEVARNPE